MNRALVLFTRDLRVRDQQALSAAVRESAAVIPLFVLDRRLLAGAAATPNRLAFLRDCLLDLETALAARGSRLIIREGDVVEQALALAGECEASAIYMSGDTTPYALRRERRLSAACRAARIALHRLPGITVVAPGELLPAGADHYRVFTPYWRAWGRSPSQQPERAPRHVPSPAALAGAASADPRTLARSGACTSLPAGGEEAGRERLERWLRGGIERYPALHDRLDCAGTSRLSPYLHLGCLSPRAIRARAREREDFVRQLCWRDFHHQVIAARPAMAHADYRARTGRWRRDAGAAEAWRSAATGYPIVDAGMRQLLEEGFMHNRARMVVASFLTKTLGLDWRIGAAHFASLLVDADVACNVGNWQWVAGTGNDTRPSRLLNPLRQAARFDPHGDYVRRYVPELASLDGASVHRPWLLPPARRRALRYPAPLVEPTRFGEKAPGRRARS